MLDDNEDDYRLTSHLLEGFDVELEWANTVEKAIEALEAGAFDAVIVDHRLRSGSGLALLDRLKETESQVPCIVLTGFDEDDVDSQALEKGAAAFLSKGTIDGQLLARTIRYAARSRQPSGRSALNIRDVRLQVGLASGLSVKEAAEAAGMSLRTAYRRVGTPEFQEGLEKIQEQMVNKLIDKAIEDLTE